MKPLTAPPSGATALRLVVPVVPPSVRPEETSRGPGWPHGVQVAHCCVQVLDPAPQRFTPASQIQLGDGRFGVEGSEPIHAVRRPIREPGAQLGLDICCHTAGAEDQSGDAERAEPLD